MRYETWDHMRDSQTGKSVLIVSSEGRYGYEWDIPRPRGAYDPSIPVIPLMHDFQSLVAAAGLTGERPEMSEIAIELLRRHEYEARS